MSDFNTHLFVLRAITLLVHPGVHLFLRLRAASGEDGGFSHDQMKTDLTGRVRAVHFMSNGNMISKMESFGSGFCLECIDDFRMDDLDRIRSSNYIRVAQPTCRIGGTIRFALHPHLVCAHLSSLLQRKSLGGREESRPRLWSGLATCKPPIQQPPISDTLAPALPSFRLSSDSDRVAHAKPFYILSNPPPSS